MSIYKKYKCEIEWEHLIDFDLNTIIANAEFCFQAVSEFVAIKYVMNWMEKRGIDDSNLMYCRVEEDFDSEMRTNVLLWIGE